MREAIASPCGRLYIWQCQGGKYNGHSIVGLSLCAMSLCEPRREVYVLSLIHISEPTRH